MRIDVSCEDVEFLTVESGVIDCYDFPRKITVDPRQVAPDGLTRRFRYASLRLRIMFSCWTACSSPNFLIEEDCSSRRVN